MSSRKHKYPKKHPKSIDYITLYDRLRADDILVKVRPFLTPYIGRLLQWESSAVFPYAVTISPKSSPLLKKQPLLTQYSILSNYIKQTLPLYSNKYFFTFETYSDNENIHCHGFVNFRILQDIKKFRQDCRQSFNIILEPHSKDILTHVKLVGNDPTARHRWIGYLYKEMEWSIQNYIPPIYRWDDAFVKPIEHPKKTKKTIVEPVPIAQYIQINNTEPLREFHIGSIYNREPDEPYIMESETDSEPEVETTREYLEYLRLKSKFEKKPLEKLTFHKN